ALPLRVSYFAQKLGAPETTRLPLGKAAIPATATADFSHAAGVRSFDSIRRRVQCVFAGKAQLWGNDWSDDACGRCEEGSESSSSAALLAANVTRCLPRLHRFCLEVRRGAALDGFVFEVRGRHFASDLRSFAATVRSVLSIISAGDPSAADCFRSSYIPKKGWYFQFARESIFVTTFAPCYPSSNPRYQFGLQPDSCYILLQPEESFLRHDLPPDKPRSATNWDSPVDVRDRIRANFRRAGREYRIPETTSYPPAEFIVAPLDPLLDPPVQFWRPEVVDSEERCQAEQQ
ncbi:unnamed protein product, partial [Polarella glacialis]